MRKTKRKNKGVRAYSLGGILLIVLIIVLFACGVLSVSLPKCADNEGATVSSVRRSAVPDGEKINSDTITGYYIDVALNGTLANCYDYQDVKNKSSFGCRPFSRVWLDTTVLVTFYDVKSNDKPVFLSAITKVEFPATVWPGDNVQIQGDITIPIHVSAYNLFKSFNYNENISVLSRVQLIVLLGNNGLGLHRRGTVAQNAENSIFNLNVKLYSKDVPPSVNDPGSDDFEFVGGGGVNNNPYNPDKSWLEKLFDWLKSVLGFTFSYSSFKEILTIILCILVAGFLLGCVIKLFKFIFG